MGRGETPLPKPGTVRYRIAHQASLPP